ncbi:MAG TPA: DNA gyrase inhibitor YacG [Pseudobdellovibrionaceae bacterium]|nr:DNA gyrase inhibitor YacG [Pseudobdellovibrionaceae bacterium]
MSQSDSANSSDSAGAKSAGITRLVRCPACGKSTEFSTRNSARPFCSQACRDFDLGNWATERYNLSTPVNEALIEALRDLGESLDAEELQTLIESADSESPSQNRSGAGENADD